jgi:polygalacturonase
MSVPVLATAAGSALLANTTASAADAPATTPAGSRAGARVFNVREFGANGDGSSLDTDAVQAAIDACNRERGGIVLIPVGDFVVGTLELKSNVTLHIATGGRLWGSEKMEHYRAGNDIPPGNGNIVMFSAANAENITIEGRGTIDGNGLKFYTGQGDNTGPSGNTAQGYFHRPHLIVFYRCRNIMMRDVFLTASAYHCVRILQCHTVYMDGVRIHNRVNRNNDGFHFSSCQYVHVVNCDIACQDDACALFGSNRFVTVTNCTFSTRWSIFRFGGGDPENITISNCVIYETYGCAIKMRFGPRSRAQNITFSNIIMKDVTGPISIGFGSRPQPGAPAQPATQPPDEQGFVRNITFKGIRAMVVATGRQYSDLHFEQGYRPGETRTCITLNGVGDEMLDNISFSDVHVIYEGGGTAEEAQREVPQIAGEYFEIGTPPAYGLYARNVRGLTLDNIRLEVSNPDLRPAMVFERVTDAAITGLSAHGNKDASGVLRFKNASDVLLTASRVLSPAAAFLRLEGNANERITVDGGDISRATTPVVAADGASVGAVKLRL